MDSTDDETENGSNAKNSDEDLPTEVPEDSVLYSGDDEADAEEADADDGSSIGRRAALGGLVVGGVAVGGALAFGGVLDGDSDASGDEEGDEPGAGTSAPDEESDGEQSSSADPAVTFDNQAFHGNGVSVTATAPGEYSVIVTYGDDGDSIVAGIADATDLSDDAVGVEFENVGGVPGTHAAHLVEGDADGYEAGDALSAETLDAVADADTAFVADEGDEAETGVTFADQALEEGAVSLELTTPDDHFVLVTYERDGEPIVAGAHDVSNLDGGTRTLALVDRDGVPGEYTAHVLANADGSEFYEPGDALSDATAEVVTAADAATVSEPDAEPQVDVSFEDQSAADGAVDLTVTAPDAHFVLVTYASDGERIVAGADDVSGLDGETISVDIRDGGGVGGLHTAYIIANEDGSKVYEPGDAVSEWTAGSVKVASTAIVGEE